jgi:uncharacterized damage-inducible protein DinB
MNDNFQSLFAYNRWADRRVLEACRKLTADQYSAEPAPGWSSVRSSLVHIAVATEGWLRGVAGENVQNVLSEAELATVDDIENLLERGYRIFEQVAPALTPEILATPRTFSGRGRTAVLAPWAVLRHIVNHATYHRGQVASKLRRLGIEPPMTDMIFWVMEQTGVQSQPS